ncbi:unnamed protein product [Polarella glacialis]|uniref:FAD-binding PCMH-type domain-containing protein n=1 Tax=Polarella glacialis TaxID=89957 RepID=A0A813ISL2_POLGL|nr:unnamed protein product [Polarella glacialis]
MGSHGFPLATEDEKFFECDGGSAGAARARGLLEGACWPDPDPRPGCSKVMADDVTRLNATEVERIFYVRSEADIKQVLAQARQEGRRISARGTKHSMGGQSIAPSGFIVDMTKLTSMRYDLELERVTCGTGCTWADLIQFLNPFGMSPRTMQSYSSFSVGGTISVNGHGITTDFCLAESVCHFRLVKWDGSVVTCSREAEGEGAELFRLALGGYGLFGVIPEVTLKVNRNARLEMDSLNLNVDEFLRTYAFVQESEDVEIKLARLNILDLNSIDMYIFRRGHGAEQKTVSALDMNPREMTWKTRLMYKWIMPTMREARYAIEKKTGAALDWSDANERNVMMHESAEPLARLYEPLFRVDDTFVLQEFFVPRSGFKAWLARVQPIYAELARHASLVLLNTTIRFVKHDPDTCLSYAQAKEGMFAFVLYYRLPRTKLADTELHRFHSLFVGPTLELGGTFYLPYRHHYTSDQLLTAYPQVRELCQRKEHYDPHGLFSNLWFEAYLLPLCTEGYRLQLASEPRLSEVESPAHPVGQGGSQQPLVVSDRRCDSYSRLVRNVKMRRDFVEGFLVRIFNVLDNQVLNRMITKATWDPECDSDIKVYRCLQRQLSSLGGPVHEATKMWKQMKQLSHQKKELAREAGAIVSRMGRLGQLDGYLSVGDHGKMVLPLKVALQLQGKVFVAHGELSEDIPAVAERGSVDPVGVFVHWDLLEAGPFVGIPDSSLDLVTMMQGLHHLRQNRLLPFLAEVVRVLRPGGLFIVREHDASEELMPMLDLAHSVFNAVLGVTDPEEEKEIRAFRSLLDWRAVVEASGLRDSLLYEMEANDPTLDEMMCFYKPPFRMPDGKSTQQVAPMAQAKACDITLPGSAAALPPQLSAFLDQLPLSVLDTLKGLLRSMLGLIPQLAELVKGNTSILSAGQQSVAGQVIDQIAEPLVRLLEKFEPYLDHVEFQSAQDGIGSFIPNELFLLVPALLRKAEKGHASVNELFAVAMIKDLELAFGFAGAARDDGAAPNQAGSVSAVESVQADLVRGSEVSAAEVQAALDDLCRAMPDLQDSSLMTRLGLNRRAQTALWAQLDLRKEEVTSAVLAEALAGYLDARAWHELRKELLAAQVARELPSKNSVLGCKGPDNAWRRALVAILGSSKVKLRQLGIMGLSLAGLSEVVEMWRLAQALRGAPALRQKEESKMTSSILAAMEGMEAVVKSVSMQEDALWDVPDVAEVLEATFGYESLTARLEDVTAQVSQHFLSGGVLKLHGRNLKNDLLRRDALTSGLDALRMGIVGKQRLLHIRYRSSAEPDPEVFLSRVATLLDRLGSFQLTQRLHPDAGEYTWYKLNEWMQVEMCQIYGRSLEHTPWYRFPYTQFLKVYFDCLFQEAGIVSKLHGQKKAFLSMGFFTSLVPGLVMASLFGQLQLLATPFLMLGSESGFGDSYDESKMVEQLVVQVPSTDLQPKWKELDSRIQAEIQVVPGLHVLKVPTFRALTEVLCLVAKALPHARVLEISNQRHVQMRVELRDHEPQLRQLAALTGCEVMFKFKYPTDGSCQPPTTSVSLCIAVPYLLATIRFCNRIGVEVRQVFDFYC